MSLCVPGNGYRGYLRIVSSPYPDFMDWVRKIHSLKRTTKEVRFLMTPTPEFRENSRERGARSPAYCSQRFDPPSRAQTFAEQSGKVCQGAGRVEGLVGSLERGRTARSAAGVFARGGRQTAEPRRQPGFPGGSKPSEGGLRAKTPEKPRVGAKNGGGAAQAGAFFRRRRGAAGGGLAKIL